VAIFLFSVGGIFSVYEGIHKMIHPNEQLENTTIMFIILAVAVVLESYSAIVATRELKKSMGNASFLKYIRKSKDQVLVTVLFEDYAALLGLVIAMGGLGLYMATGNVIYDSIASILIGVLLICIAFFLYREASSLLVGEAASPEDQAKIEKAFTSHPKVIKVKELLTMHMSPSQILVNAHVKFTPGITLEDVENTIDEIELMVVDAVPEVYKIFIETHQKDQVEDIRRGSKTQFMKTKGH
jgi:cation diffusion facilitator family transporter